MRNVTCFLVSSALCFIVALFVCSKFTDVGFKFPLIASWGTIMVFIGVILLFASDLCGTSIALIIFGFFMAIPGIDGNFGLVKEFLEWGFRIGY